LDERQTSGTVTIATSCFGGRLVGFERAIANDVKEEVRVDRRSDEDRRPWVVVLTVNTIRDREQIS
jgi:hypothetical protein